MYPNASGSTHKSVSVYHRKIKPQIVLVAAIILFCSFQIFVSVHKFYNFEASTMDLGDFEQEFWKISHGDWWAFSTVFQTPAVASDGSLFVYPLAYGFRFLGGANFLFVIQALGTGLTSWGIYRAALLNKLTDWQASVIAIIFLLYPAIIGGSQFDFHPDFIALPFVVWAYVCYMVDNKRLYYSLLLLAVLSKNVALISIGGWGFGLLVWKHQRRDGLIALGGSLLFFFVEMDWIIPRYFNGATERINLSLYGYLGHGFTGILIGIIERFPVIVHHLLQEGPYALWIFGPVLAVSLFGSASVPAMLSLFCLNALSTLPAQHTVNDQYQVILAGWVFLAFIEAVARLQSKRRLFLVGAGISTLALEMIFVTSAIVPLLRVTNPTLPNVENAVRRIPAGDVVWTQNHMGPWAYKFKTLGIDKEGVPGEFIDSLSLLWRERSPNKTVPTVLLAERPVSPYFADVMHDALQFGYHLTFHQGPVFILSGSREFPVPAPSTIGFGWQPNGSSWVIPAWTQQVSRGHINWHQQAVSIPSKTHGVVFPGILMELGPGVYQLAVRLSTRSSASTSEALIGALLVNHQEVSIHEGDTKVYIDVILSHPEVLKLTLMSTGRSAFSVDDFYVKRLSHEVKLKKTSHYP